MIPSLISKNTRQSMQAVKPSTTWRWQREYEKLKKEEFFKNLWCLVPQDVCPTSLLVCEWVIYTNNMCLTPGEKKLA